MPSSVTRVSARAASSRPPSQSFTDRFSNFSRAVAGAVGSPWAFFIAVLTVVLWAALGPWTNYSDDWQLVINTGTTIVTFFIVFLIQNTQNRETRVIQLKLDELIRAVTPARTELINMENMSEAELQALKMQFEEVQAEAARSLEKIAASRKSPSQNT